VSEALKVLGLTDAASPDDVRRVYRERARAAHPDGGGSLDKFQALHFAYTAALAQQTAAPCPACRGTKRVEQTRGYHTTTIDCAACGRTGRRFP
jgi:DnaJ-class molecular chaperone